MSLNDIVYRMKNIETPYDDDKKKNGAIIVCRLDLVEDKRIASIDQTHLDLVEDIEAFNQYICPCVFEKIIGSYSTS